MNPIVYGGGLGVAVSVFVDGGLGWRLVFCIHFQKFFCYISTDHNPYCESTALHTNWSVKPLVMSRCLETSTHEEEGIVAQTHFSGGRLGFRHQ